MKSSAVISGRKRTANAAAWTLAAASALAFGAPEVARSQAAPQVRTSGPSSHITVEGNPQLFATLCALYASGYAQDLNLANSAVRKKIAERMSQVSGPATEALQQFYRDHQLADPAATLSRYMSFAMVAGRPPKFAYTVAHDDLPPDVLPIEGFNDVLAAFYAEAGIGELWRSVQNEYDAEVARIASPFAQIAQTVTGYLRELIPSSSPRTFAVYVDPLVGEKTNFRNYGAHYDIVVGGGADPPLDDIRHAFLHFMLESLVTKNAVLVAQKKPLREIAARAPRLPAEYREDFTAFFVECLVRAVELRLRRLPGGAQAAALDQADAEGMILIRPVTKQLVAFEQAEPSMSLWFPDLLRGIDTNAEAKRLENVKFAAAPEPAAATPVVREAAPAQPADLRNWLKEGDAAIKAQNPQAAEAAFDRVLAKYPDTPAAVFGLALASLLKGEGDHARELFQKMVAPAAESALAGEAQKDPLIQSWSHVYLGHFYDLDRDRDAALKEYRAVLGVEGAPQGALEAAQRGIEKPYGPPAKNARDTKPNG